MHYKDIIFLWQKTDLYLWVITSVRLKNGINISKIALTLRSGCRNVFFKNSYFETTWKVPYKNHWPWMNCLNKLAGYACGSMIKTFQFRYFLSNHLEFLVSIFGSVNLGFWKKHLAKPQKILTFRNVFKPQYSIFERVFFQKR